MWSKGSCRNFRRKLLTQNEKGSIESPLAPAGLLAESIQSLQELGRIVFQPDLAHNFQKASFVSGSQHPCQVEFCFSAFLLSSVSRRFLRTSRRFSSSITWRISSSSGIRLQGSSDVSDSITLQLADWQVGRCGSTQGADRMGHAYDAGDFGNIVHADDVCAAKNRCGHGGSGAEDSPSSRQGRLSRLRQCVAEKGLSRRANHDRATQ